jgi:hypothetical protein
LSKSKYLIGLQCPKLLWTHYKSKKTIPEVSPGTQAAFDQGHEIGELAKMLFPDGIDVEWEQDTESVIKQSLERDRGHVLTLHTSLSTCFILFRNLTSPAAFCAKRLIVIATAE